MMIIVTISHENERHLKGFSEETELETANKATNWIYEVVGMVLERNFVDKSLTVAAHSRNS